jgi:two-component system, NtrC family, nitrogen regulation sensor histidine kinase NtrY
LDRLSKSLEATGREYYRQAREVLRRDAQTGMRPHATFSDPDRAHWPAEILEFWDSGEPERFRISGDAGERLEYAVRRDGEVWLYSRPLGDLRMEDLTNQYREARRLVELAKARDLRRGFTRTLVVLVAAIWLVSFILLVYMASRVSQPIQELTAGLSELASGHLDTRIGTKRDDEIGRAIDAFNRTAGQLEQNRDRLVYLTQIASWQTLARKMAHELKNSLTPIRLTVEEILARQPEDDRKFMAEAAQIVVNEVESLERRVRAFSEFSSDPPLRPATFDLNALLQERIAFLKPGHAAVSYELELGANLPAVVADIDRIRGVLTNLVENAAEAAGSGGRVLGMSYSRDDKVYVEIHDSGPGLSNEARKTLFEPTITFKSRGMGLGLSIARKDALVCGGDLTLIEGKLGGAGFRVVLPKSSGAGSEKHG